MAPTTNAMRAGLLLSTTMVMLLLLGGDHTVLGVDAEPTLWCNTQSYAGDSTYAQHVIYVTVDLWKTTPAQPGYDYYNTSGGSEPVYGHAKCSIDLSPDDCQKCIDACLKLIRDNCGTSIGAQAVLDDCQLRYEAYPIQN